MKRQIYFILLLVTAMSFTACKKFLDTKPTDNFAPENYYSTEAELNTALIGVYDPISTEILYGNRMFTDFNCTTDESYYDRATPGVAGQGLQTYTHNFTNQFINDMWASLYRGIERANLLIANINKPSMDEAKRKEILAQALFLRAFYHFELVKNFGDVPLKLTPTASVSEVNFPRTPSKDVYAQIIKDMTEAEAILPEASVSGTASRISKGTAQGMLARVCLFAAGFPVLDASKYAQALTWAAKVKASGEHSLRQTFTALLTNSAYSQIFIDHTQDKYDVKESMWEAECSGNRLTANREEGRVGNTNGILITATTLQMNSDTGYSYGFTSTTKRLYDLYGNGDLRRDWAIAPFNYNGATGLRNNFTAAQIYQRNCGKWRRTYELLKPKHENNTPTNFPLLRYADVLLMLAEAENQVNGPTAIAYDAINQVRRRGYGLPVASPSVVADLPAGLSQTQFLKAVQDERARELCFEALRRNDLIRWGIFVTTMNGLAAEIEATAPAAKVFAAARCRNVTSRHIYLPIPSGEISVNKAMTQNPGW